MSNHEHHEEDPQVDMTVGLFFIGVLAVIFLIGLLN